MSPISSSTLLRRQDTEDSPLSITANVIGIVTFIFAVGVAAQVYVWSCKSAEEDWCALLRAGLDIIQEAKRVLRKIDPVMEQFQTTSQTGWGGFYVIPNENGSDYDFSEAFHISCGLEIAKKFLFLAIDNVENLGAGSIDPDPDTMRSARWYSHWSEWRFRTNFRAEEQELKKAHEDLIRRTAHSRGLISDAEKILSTMPLSSGEKLSQYTPPIRIVLSKLKRVQEQNMELKQTIQEQNMELKQNFNDLLKALQHHLPSDALAPREYLVSKRGHQSLLPDPRPRRLSV